MTTDKQKSDIHFCEQYLNITFDGDIEDEHQVSEFLHKYFQEAKYEYEALKCEYEAYLWDLG